MTRIGISHLAFAVVLSVLGWIETAGAGSPQGIEIGQRVPQFTVQALDVSGEQPRPTELDSQRMQRVTVYVVAGTHCHAAFAAGLAQIEQTYVPKGVDFVYLYPNRDDTPDQKIAFHKEKKFSGLLIDDQRAKLAFLLDVHKTSELLVTDRQGVVVYRGALDDSNDPKVSSDPKAVKQNYLAMALDATLAGKPVAVAHSQVFA